LASARLLRSKEGRLSLLRVTLDSGLDLDSGLELHVHRWAPHLPCEKEAPRGLQGGGCMRGRCPGLSPRACGWNE